MANPIIPAYKRTPKDWSGERFGNPSAREIVSGYVDAFDPDVLVQIGETKVAIGDQARPIIKPSDIWVGDDLTGPPKYGIGSFEVMDHFINREMKFKRKLPMDISFVQLGEDYPAFWGSVFGILPESMGEALKPWIAHLEADNPIPSMENFLELLDPEKLFPRRMTLLYVDRIRSKQPRRDCLFFLDAADPLDIIDYWNLRACGWDVVPIPKQALNSPNTRTMVQSLIDENYFPLRGNPSLFNSTTILKGRSILENEFTIFYSSLLATSAGTPQQPKISVQTHYPRMWDEWARSRDGAEYCELEARSQRKDVTFVEEGMSLKSISPKFMSRDLEAYHLEPRFANEIEVRLYGGDEPFAEVFPEGGQSLSRALRGYGSGRWRFSKGGPVVLLSRHDGSISLSAPRAEAVFGAWLEDKGWKSTLSAPGHLAKQIYKRLGGKWGIGTIAHELLIRLLNHMEAGKALNAKDFRGKIQEIIGRGDIRATSKSFIQRLMEIDMFRLGVEVQCPICTQRSWYSLNDIKENLQCQKCLSEFVAPAYSPEELQWSYRTFGPFSLPSRAYGVYSVLLTLHFFMKRMDGACTPMMSFTAVSGTKRLEADLGLFFKESHFGATGTETIFAECKSYNEFERADIQRMSLLAESFPGAVLVFSTFQRSLTKREKILIGRIARKGRRYWKAERPYNPVLVLTGTELFSDDAPPECWKNAGGAHAEHAKRYGHRTPDLLELCDATQQLYLGLKPWQEWLRERWEKRRTKSPGVLTALPPTP